MTIRTRLFSLLMAVIMVISLMPMSVLATDEHVHDEEALATTVEEAAEAPSAEAVVETTPAAEDEAAEAVCTCESDDPASHAPFCALYTAPEAPVCFCVEQCAEGSVNEWCDVCYFDHAACAASGEEAAVEYDWLSIYTPEDLKEYFTVVFDSYELELCVGQEGRLPYTFEWNPDYSNSIKAFGVVPNPVSPYAEMVDPNDPWTIRGLKAGEAQFTLQVDYVILGRPAIGLANFTVKVYDHSYANGFCTRCGGYEPAELVDGYYQIGNGGQMFWFANHINTVDRTASAKLTADIDLENRAWTPIGSTGEGNNNFRGHFDGQNHTIKNLKVEGGRAGLGFFGEVRCGTVENFTIYGEVTLKGQYNYVGGVIGSAPGVGSNPPDHNGATVRNITSYVNVTLGEGSHGSNRVGGFMGYANHETLIENCVWYGTLNLGPYRAQDGVGGLVGKANDNSAVTIKNCAAYGTIKTSYQSESYSGYNTIYIGGIVSNSVASAKTTIVNTLWAGKIVNETNLGTNAHISAFGSLNGIGSVTNCYALNNAPYITTNGSHNSYITTVTEDQLESGEVAYKLGTAWGQTIGTNNYPVLGGAKVYSVTNCKNEVKYSNTNQNIDHNWENGICTVCDGYQSANGSGTESDPYKIGNAGQLYWFAKQVNGGDADAWAELTDNIVVNENVLKADGTLNGNGGSFLVWTPISKDYANRYTGTFDGKNKTISGLYFSNSETDHVGLFGYIGEGTVKNVGVVDSYLHGERYVGGIAGESNSKNSTVTDCYHTGSVSGNYAVGGLIGSNMDGTVTNCYNTGSVSGESAGGVVGYSNSTGTVTNCYNTGSVSGGESPGGVVGHSNGTVTDCYNTGTVSGDYYAGGVVGDNGSTVTNCYNTGTVSGNYYVGGVVGRSNSNTSAVTNCYNTGSVSGNYYLGGLMGTNSGTVTHCYNSGTVSGGYHRGGLMGTNSGTVTNCYYNNTVYNGNAINYNRGTATAVLGKTTEQFNSGEVAYLLGEAFGQTIGTDASPVLGGAKVYCGYGSCAEIDEMVYTNNEDDIISEKPSHSYTHGICTVCGKVCEHDYKNGFCTECGEACAHSYENGICTVCGEACAHSYENGFCTACGDYEPASGNGTEADPYLISNAGQLYWFAKQVNAGQTSINGKLTANIEVNENVLNTDGTLRDGSFRPWTPIGDDTNIYTGIFDGDNHTISGLYFSNSETNFVGLFGYISEGTVENVGVEDSYFSGYYAVGGVVGRFDSGTVTNCYNTGTVSGGEDVGGVVGHIADGTVTDCYNTGIVSGEKHVGGVVGYNNYGTVTDCYNTGAVSGNDSYVGGVVGYNYDTVTDCYNTGAVSGYGEANDYGAVGSVCYVGGVVGYNNYGTVTNCYNSGAVSGDIEYVGGVVGENKNGTVTDCYNTGAVSGKYHVGGVVGDNYDTVTDCYSIGAVSGEYRVGGVVGLNHGTVTNSYYDKTVYNRDAFGDNYGNATNVEGKTTEFSSGEVAYLLQGEQTEQVWGQNVDGEGTKDAYPVLGGKKVYYGYDSCGENAEMVYTNKADVSEEKPSHSFADGKCTVCGMVCEHEYDRGECIECGKICVHEYKNGYCTICGDMCEHGYVDGKCPVCGMVCDHTFDDDGFCTVCGAFDNTGDAKLGDNTVAIPEGYEYYYWTYIAEADGELLVTISGEKHWCYAINNKTTQMYGDTHWSDSDPVVNPCKVAVSKGDELEIVVSAYDPANPWGYPAATLTITLEYEVPFAFFGSNVTLGNELDLNFAVEQKLVPDGAYAIITRSYSDGKSPVTSDKIYVKDWDSTSSPGLYLITYKGLAAKEMGDEVTVVVYDKDGKELGARKDSIQSYAMRTMGNLVSIINAKTLLIKMLDYGAAAQVEFGYDTENHVNAEITEAMRNDYPFQSKAVTNSGTPKDDVYMGTSLVLENRIEMQMGFVGDPTGVTARVTYKHHDTTPDVDVTITADKFYKYTDKNGNVVAYGVIIPYIMVADARQDVTVTLNFADGTTKTVTDSIASYVARNNSKGIYGAIMDFSDAAYAYLH